MCYGGGDGDRGGGGGGGGDGDDDDDGNSSSRGRFPRALPRTIASLWPGCSRPFHNIKEEPLTSPTTANKCPTLAEWKCLRYDPRSTVN